MGFTLKIKYNRSREMIPVCGHSVPNVKTIDTAAVTRPVSGRGRVDDDFNDCESIVQLLQAVNVGFIRYYKFLKNRRNCLSKIAIFVVIL